MTPLVIPHLRHKDPMDTVKANLALAKKMRPPRFASDQKFELFAPIENKGRMVPGGAATCSEGFVNSFLRVP